VKAMDTNLEDRRDGQLQFAETHRNRASAASSVHIAGLPG